jgi:hypothetical protein
LQPRNAADAPARNEAFLARFGAALLISTTHKKRLSRDEIEPSSDQSQNHGS